MTTGTKPIEIVIVEDNCQDADLVGIILQEHQIPFRMRVIRDGAKAIELLNALDGDLKAPRLDLFIVDMHLPKRRGEDVLNRLRSTERYAQCPVIIMTGLDSPIVELAAVKHAPIVYFRKPSTLEEYMQLGPMIRQVLGTNARNAA
jgi:DNA-binding response OmpR family regulator